jgi:hypothetical protein
MALVFFLFPGLEPLHHFNICSDASGTIGYGAVLGAAWFNGHWLSGLSIVYKEFFPIVVAAHIWCHGWQQRHILFEVYNEYYGVY